MTDINPKLSVFLQISPLMSQARHQRSREYYKAAKHGGLSHVVKSTKLYDSKKGELYMKATRKMGIGLVILALVAMAAAGATAFAQPQAEAEIAEIKLPLNWQLNMGSMFKHASPTLADIDNNGTQEILVGNTNGTFYCVNHDGNFRWTYYTGAPIQSTPLAVDCDGDGRLEIFFGCDNGLLYGLNADGQCLSQWGWPKSPGSAFGYKEVFPSPAAGDLDGDGNLEIVVGTWGHYITAWHSEGPLAFQYYNADTVWSSPAVADIDLDGQDEVIIGADCWGGVNWPYARGGLLYAFEGNGAIMPGWPKQLPQVIWSSPAIADLDGDSFPDIVVGTGLFWQNTSPGASNYLSYADGKFVYAFNYRGDSLPGWPVRTGNNNFSSPAVADIDGDGFYEVAIGSMDYNTYVLNHDGSQRWVTRYYDVPKLGSPAIADINSDGLLDVIMAEGGNLTARDPNGGMFLNQNVGGNIFNCPAVGDIDQDGRVEVIVATGMDGETGLLASYEAGTFNPALMPWPMFRRNARHTGGYNYEEVPDMWPPEEVKSRGYLAEGFTGAGFNQFILLMNTQDIQMPVQIRYAFPSGKSVVRMLYIPPHSRATVPVNATVNGQEVSTSVISNQEGLITERAIYFNYTGGGGSWLGGHDVMGTDSPLKEWYFAEGCTRPGFHTWLTLQNPGEIDAQVAIDYYCGDGQHITKSAMVKAKSRYTVAVHGDAQGIGVHNNEHGDVSIKVTSSEPIVAERPMYFNYNGVWDGGHNVMGAEAPSPEWYFAEGCTRSGFNTWLCLQNPGDEPAQVRLDYLCGDGKNEYRELTIEPRSRYTVAVHGKGLGIGVHDNNHGDVSIKVTSDQPIVAERPMYFNYFGFMKGGHNVVGSPKPYKQWLFAEGCTRSGFHTWLCLQNPTGEPAQVRLDYLCGDGVNEHRELTIEPRSRFTLAVHGEGLGIGVQDNNHGDVSIKVTSDQPIVAERPMYFSLSGGIVGGHNTQGYPME
jgi:hypothetical protein